MTEDFDQILDQCVGGLQSGSLTLESCLAQFPGHAKKLEPLLRLAAHSHAVLAPSGPSSSYIKTTRMRLMNRIRSQGRKRSTTSGLRRKSRRFLLRPAYVVVAAALVLGLLGSGFGVVRASADSLPGDGLYAIKLAGEQIRLGITFSSKSDKALLIGFAGQRLEEAKQLVDLGRFEDLELAMNGLDQAIESLALIRGGEDDESPGAIVHIEENLARHMEVLQRVLEQVPESARGAIENAIERSTQSQEVIKRVKAADHPSNTAPGQLKKNGEGDDLEDLQPGQGNGRDKIRPEKPTKTEKAPDKED